MRTRRVFKYSCDLDDKFTLSLPVGAEILTVQAQHGMPILWALVDPKQPLEERYFRLAGTGHPIMYDMGSEYNYIGTFQLHGGSLIFHLFEMNNKLM